MTLRPQTERHCCNCSESQVGPWAQLHQLDHYELLLLRCQFGCQKVSKPPSMLHRYWSDRANKGHWKQDRWEKLDKVLHSPCKEALHFCDLLRVIWLV